MKEPGDSVSIEADCEDVYAVAATNGKESAVLLTLYNDERESDEKDICIEVQRPHSGECVRAEYYLLDEDNDMALVCEEFFTSERFNIRLKIKSYETYMIKFKQAD